MEDVLRVYERPRDPARPLVCVDESSRQLVAHSRDPIPARPGSPERWDYEYVRNGVADVFMAFAPLECERLHGLPDGYTKIPYRGKPPDECPDTPRYKALGNGWAVNCARWIAQRIQEHDKETRNGNE